MFVGTVFVCISWLLNGQAPSFWFGFAALFIFAGLPGVLILLIGWVIAGFRIKTLPENKEGP
jgi:hypothetical protein